MTGRCLSVRATAALVLLALAGCGQSGDLAPDAADGSGSADASVDAAYSVPSSCVSLPSTCGAAGTAGCCESPTVPGGTFFRGYDVGADAAFADLTRPATVSSFRLDRYEVTVGRFRQFVASGSGTQANPPPAGAGARTLNGMASQAGWDPAWNSNLVANSAALAAALECSPTYQTWTDTPGANENMPINCITWWEAMAFCAWDGGFLPTLAQSMYAMSGGEQRAYPWSSPAASTTLDCTLSNWGTPNGLGCPGHAHAIDVGSLSPAGDGVWGQADLSGNVFEWALDWSVSVASSLPMPCDDCANLIGPSFRHIRGGSFVSATASMMRAGSRSFATPTFRGHEDGVRCARSL